MPKTNPLRSGALAVAALAALALPASADHGGARGQAGAGGHDRLGSVVLYADSDFRGEGISVNGAIPDLSRMRFNDRASSIVIHSGAWEVCVDANFRGRCEVIHASTTRLGTHRLNDNISSLRPAAYRAVHDQYASPRNGRDGSWRDNRARTAGLILFADSGQRGQGVEISHDVPNLGDYRFNDRASSFFVSGGTWLACEHANYRGRCEVLARGPGDLKPIRLNDNISSVRRYDGRRNYSQYPDGWR